MRLFGEQFQSGVLRDPVTAIIGGISAGTNLLGGIFKSNAAKGAAQIQADAANKAAEEVGGAADKVNPGILAAAKAAGDTTTEVAARGGEDVYQHSLESRDNVNAAAVAANAGLDPYSVAGESAAHILGSGIQPGGDFNKNPTLADLQIDPGYAFRLQQGEEALTRSAAAHGAVGGGGFAKDLNNYVQGSASQEYQNAFNRFETATQNRFANLTSVANAGQLAATTKGKNTLDASQFGENAVLDATKFKSSQNTDAQKFSGSLNVDATDLAAKNTLDAITGRANYETEGANALAGGKVASSNAMWNGFSGAAGGALNAYLMSRPANNYFLQAPRT